MAIFLILVSVLSRRFPCHVKIQVLFPAPCREALKNQGFLFFVDITGFFILIPFCDRFSTEDCERFFSSGKEPERKRSSATSSGERHSRAEKDPQDSCKVANWYQQWFFRAASLASRWKKGHECNKQRRYVERRRRRESASSKQGIHVFDQKVVQNAERIAGEKEEVMLSFKEASILCAISKKL